MKLLYITNGINGVGGLEHILCFKTRYFIDFCNYEIHILTLEEKIAPFYPFSDRIHLHNVAIPNNALYIYRYIIELQKNIRAIMPDVISVCDDGIKGFFIPGIIGKKIPVIYERHASIMLNTNQLFTGAIKRYIMRIRAKDFQKFVVLTNLGLKEWNTSNSIVISNPLSFYPANSSNLRNKTVIAAGTHSYIKGYDLLLKTWKIVTEKYPDWKLNIYGKIDISETFIKLANKLGLTDYIHFYAPVLNLEDAYMQASVMVLSSRSEGFGNVLTEAMACGLPCISFDSLIGPMEIITNGKDGFLVKKNSVKELAEKIIYLIENEDRRREMGQAAKENVKKYLPEDILLQWKLLFEQVVNEY